MAISAAMVKELRERTGSGMMECKKALVETNGDIDAAVELLRKTGQAKADKKAGRVAADGMIAMTIAADGKSAAMVEVNSETDFVATSDEFVGFCDRLVGLIGSHHPVDVEALQALPYDSGMTVNEARQGLVARIGENITIRRFADYHTTDGLIGGYRHGTRIGVLVELRGGDAELARDVAMHIAAIRPLCVAEDDVPPELLAKEREIYAAQAAESGKPPQIVEKMVEGRIKKFLKENTLLGQPFVKDTDRTVGELVAAAGAAVVRFARLEVGEGIEKKADNFADEVMAQVRGS